MPNFMKKKPPEIMQENDTELGKMARKSKKPKKPKNKNNRNLLGLVLSVLIAICVFIGLVSYQTTVLSNYEKVSRVVVTKDLAKGTRITQQNVNEYFKLDEIDAQHDVTNAVKSLEDLVGHVSTSQIVCGQTASFSNFIDEKSLLANVSEPVYISFTVAKAGDAVGGTIRAGNIIDVDVSSSEGVIVAGESLFVTAVYDANFIRLTENDANPALTIEVALDADKVDDFVSAISSGNAFVSRRDQ